MTGSSDGVIKIFKRYESESKVTLVSAWRALTDLVNSNVNAGLVLEWQQGKGRALVAGDVKVIRVWDAATELCTSVSLLLGCRSQTSNIGKSILARSGACITSLTSDQVAGNILVAGFGDGAVRVYDQRIDPRSAMIEVWKDHKQWVTKVHMQRGGVRDLISASRDGYVKLWDLRMPKSINTIQAAKETLRTLSVHEHAPVFAA